ncbi:histone acetylation protein-domain-containing protein [Boeremia exigua]|uniref:histone acetylation protein-domain-containing protein n=1 Tax=Boeremia exigua TaxID=749465 RepID=UPI001E8CD384|nr:histone acetylation protein-domain-containing protein [Boeremia exigua]KAH6638949.1 histone acetylation protein-domain-containing protein [Boeremia exigua]
MADIPSRRPLRDLLADQLPKDVPFAFYHYSTPPTKSPALFSAPPHLKAERTSCESHFLAATITPAPDDAAAPLPEELLILAIEVLVYTTRRLTTIFVSKADSTGYLAELQLPRAGGSPLKAICGTFVAWLARERQREGKKLVISLFARAQDQYLFPASIDNKNKHVLDDRGLVKWWCNVLDPIVSSYPAESRKSFHDRLRDSETAATTTAPTAHGYLLIPGYDSHATLRCVPRTPDSPPRWSAAHPLLALAPHPAAPPRCLVPHFPDDPKARFLDELDEELPGGDAGGTPSRSTGAWRSVKTLEQFWELMAFRQECSSGRIVGFVWVVITPGADISGLEEQEQLETEGGMQLDASQSTQPSQISPSQGSLDSRPSPRKPKKRTHRTKSRPRTGPIPLLLPRIKTANPPPSTHHAAAKPPPNRDTLLFTPSHYRRATDVLLHSSFATRGAAARSTAAFKREVGVLGGGGRWGWVVVGRRDTRGEGGAGEREVTVLSGRVEKRDGETVLGDALVRKKVKTEHAAGEGKGKGTGEGKGVQVLGAGLVRRKPKP